ncbi:formin-like protein 20 [Trichosurus vulpecula]|uniref:formin-like protein 20 n=1 Tax=Trichosurus vulpecula TaxID=9337 RepID=UPI00186ABF6A|nr:formin-like protein 20 [Trichosurus vulpecula]
MRSLFPTYFPLPAGRRWSEVSFASLKATQGNPPPPPSSALGTGGRSPGWSQYPPSLGHWVAHSDREEISTHPRQTSGRSGSGGPSPPGFQLPPLPWLLRPRPPPPSPARPARGRSGRDPPRLPSGFPGNPPSAACRAPSQSLRLRLRSRRGPFAGGSAVPGTPPPFLPASSAWWPPQPSQPTAFGAASGPQCHGIEPPGPACRPSPPQPFQPSASGQPPGRRVTGQTDGLQPQPDRGQLRLQPPSPPRPPSPPAASLAWGGGKGRVLYFRSLPSPGVAALQPWLGLGLGAREGTPGPGREEDAGCPSSGFRNHHLFRSPGRAAGGVVTVAVAAAPGARRRPGFQGRLSSRLLPPPHKGGREERRGTWISALRGRREPWLQGPVWGIPLPCREDEGAAGEGPLERSFLDLCVIV